MIACLGVFDILFLFTASFDGEKHAINLPSVNSASFVLRFLEKLCHSLQCDNLFSSQPFSPYMGCAHSPMEYDRNKPAKEEIPENRSAKRYSQDSPSYTAPLSPKLPRNDAHPSEGNYVMSELYMRIIYGFSISSQNGLSTTYVSGLSLAFDRSGWKSVNY